MTDKPYDPKTLPRLDPNKSLDVTDDLGIAIDKAYITGKKPVNWTEDTLEQYAKKAAPRVAEKVRGTYSICDIHRMIYHRILDSPESLSEPTVQKEVQQLLEQAFAIAKKTDARLRMYKNNFDEGWWEEERAKHNEWMEELKSKK
tara:strand:- start:713 stop:1147 length:435 start_codon:yes stop_codon:yes gene_type:complete